MTARALAPLFLAALMVLGPGVAFAAPDAPEAENPDATRFADTAARIQALPEEELKRFYLRCAQASVRGQIGSGEIALCSIGYERLLQRDFGGNFRAFLEWRRNPYGEKEPARPSPF